MLTQERLKELLSYDPHTGLFAWIVDRTATAKKGSVAGTVANRWAGLDYVVISVLGRKYYAHQLAVLYMTGQFPKCVADHIDGNGTNNAWSNLRQANIAENAMHSKKPLHNTSGIKNVGWYKRLKKWRVTVKNQTRSVDRYFDDLELAELVAEEARSLLHGKFAKHA